MTEDAFLRTILANPKDDAPLLIYSDWLEEQGDPVSSAKAEFLRVTVQFSHATPSKGSAREIRKRLREVATLRKRLQELAASLDTEWLGVVSRLRIENCRQKPTRPENRITRLLHFEFVCDRQWQELQPTEDQGVRFCDACKQGVHYCDTIGEARRHSTAGHCVAVDLGVIRREGDLAPQLRLLRGMVTDEMVRQEEQRSQPDPVSAARERRKEELRNKAESVSSQSQKAPTNDPAQAPSP